MSLASAAMITTNAADYSGNYHDKYFTISFTGSGTNPHTKTEEKWNCTSAYIRSEDYSVSMLKKINTPMLHEFMVANIPLDKVKVTAFGQTLIYVTVIMVQNLLLHLAVGLIFLIWSEKININMLSLYFGRRRKVVFILIFN